MVEQESALDLSLPCSQQSTALGEPIHGTATAHIGAWLLIEHRERWEPRIEDTPFPAALRDKLEALDPRHRVRVQLIRRWQATGPLQAFVVRMGSDVHPEPSIMRFRIDRHEELAALDLNRILDGTSEAPAAPDPPSDLFLVCTHGKRDRCCAMWGVAFCKALVDAAPPGEVWQCSHLGGHRFAATAVHLPSGIQYGRLAPEEAPQLAEAHRAGRLYDLRRYRGQTRYPAAVQAAEAWLREHTGDLSLVGPAFVEAQQHGARTSVRFQGVGNIHHRVVVEPRRGTIARKASCESEDLSVAQWLYTVRHEAQMVEDIPETVPPSRAGAPQP